MYGGKMRVKLRYKNKEFAGLPEIESLYVDRDSFEYENFLERIMNSLR